MAANSSAMLRGGIVFYDDVTERYEEVEDIRAKHAASLLLAMTPSDRKRVLSAFCPRCGEPYEIYKDCETCHSIEFAK